MPNRDKMKSTALDGVIKFTDEVVEDYDRKRGTILKGAAILAVGTLLLEGAEAATSTNPKQTSAVSEANQAPTQVVSSNQETSLAKGGIGQIEAGGQHASVTMPAPHEAGAPAPATPNQAQANH